MKISLSVYFSLIAVFLSNSVYAEFYIWNDENGVKHISNIPRECINQNKTVVLSCNPKAVPEEVKNDRAEANELNHLYDHYDALLNKYRSTAKKGGNTFDEVGFSVINEVDLNGIRQEIEMLRGDIEDLEEKIFKSRNGEDSDFDPEFYTERMMRYYRENMEFVELEAKMNREKQKHYDAIDATYR